MQKKPKIFLFDLDGTIIDNELKRGTLLEKAIEKMGFDPSMIKYSDLVGSGDDKMNKELKNAYGDDFDTHKVFEILEELEDSEIALPRSGMPEFLEYLKSIDMRKMVVTANTRKNAVTLLSETGLINHFEMILSKDDVNNVKPDPEAYLLASKLSSVGLDECIAIEDSDCGARAAYNAGIPYVSIPSYIDAISDDIRQNAAATFTSIKDLHRWVEGILKQ